MKYEPLTFEIPELEGISTDTITNHIGLYQGYVKHVNVIQEMTDLITSSRNFEANITAMNSSKKMIRSTFKI